MTTIHVKSKEYSNKIIADLKLLFEGIFPEYRQSISIAVTGSLGKKQLTPQSDIDILIVYENSIRASKIEKNIIQALKGKKFLHTFEFYPVTSLANWHWILKKSPLLCSDLFFALYIWGNKNIFQRLMNYATANNMDNSNKRIYFLYNYLYRNQQLSQLYDESSLKYQKGGLRDMQLIKWIARRLAHCHSLDPAVYIKSLISLELINKRGYRILYNYQSLVMEIKWSKEANKKISKENLKKYELMRYKTYQLIERIKEKVIYKLFNRLFVSFIEDTKNNKLNKTAQENLFNSTKESAILCAIWNTSDLNLIKRAFVKYKEFWTVRAAIALNPNTPREILMDLLNLSYPDMNDIFLFVNRNPNFVK